MVNELLHRCRKEASTIARDGATLAYERIHMAMYADAIPRLIRQRWTISAYSLGLQPQQNLDQASLSSRFAETSATSDAPRADRAPATTTTPSAV